MTTDTTPGVPGEPGSDVDLAAAQGLITDGALVLGVREPEEWDAGHLAGARHMPLGDLDPARVPQDRPVLVVCRSGNRSGQATAALTAAGHRAYNLAGGTTAWQRAGLPLVTDAGAGR